MSRVYRLIMDGNPKVYEVAEYIATKFELNSRMLSTLKNEKMYLKHKPRRKFGDINGHNSVIFSCLVQNTNCTGLL